jgi:hypothetical protein
MSISAYIPISALVGQVRGFVGRAMSLPTRPWSSSVEARAFQAREKTPFELWL